MYRTYSSFFLDAPLFLTLQGFSSRKCLKQERLNRMAVNQQLSAERHARVRAKMLANKGKDWREVLTGKKWDGNEEGQKQQ